MPTRALEETARRGYRRILWPTNFSSLAEVPLPHAVRLAEAHAAELVVLFVLSPAMVCGLYGLPEASVALWDALEWETRTAARAGFRRVTQQLKALAPRIRTHSVLTEGVPFDQIVRVAKRLKCDLIVLATHGRTGLRQALLGSVAENVVRRAHCPVLTVRPPSIAGRE